jgi:hypothetical protein
VIPLQSTPSGSGVLVELAIAALVVLAIVGVLIWLAKRGVFQPDGNEDADQEAEEVGTTTGTGNYRIPYRRRVKAWSGPMRVFVASLVLLGLVGGVAAYQILKTGSPAQQYLTQEVRIGLAVVIGVAGGVYLKSHFDSQIGWLNIVYERAGQTNLVERVPYAQQGVRRREGMISVPEVSDNRLLGLFWRYRLRGEDRRLRAGEKPLADPIRHGIPDHGEEFPDTEGALVLTSQDGDEILDGDSSVDVTYSPPNTLSKERATQIREKSNRKEAELQGAKATNAELYSQIRKMRKKIKNDEYRDRQALLEDFDKFSSYLNSFTVSVQDELSSSDESKNGASENGQTPEVDA